MALNKVKIGDLITLNNVKNTDDKELPFYGINKDKVFMPTVATTENLDRRKYKVISKGTFVFSGMQTGRDMCIRIGMYDFDFDALISPAYTTFDVSSDQILPEYLFMIFKSPEKDRYGAFLSDSSVRANLDWDVFCNVELTLPSTSIQRKYVDIYMGVLENLDSMKRSIVELDNTCTSYMEKLIKTEEKKAIGNYIKEVDVRNDDLILQTSDVRGISTQKEFIPTKANMRGVSVANYKIVKPGWFAYVADTSRRGDKMSLAYNGSQDLYLVSSITTVFEVVQLEELLPEYLFLFLRRPEFDRYARYNSWGSARETITWEDMGRLEIPVPKKEIQQDIVNIFCARKERADIVERLTRLQKNICPILIKGAIEEGGR
jgi:type I restriction enzyme S subunit